MSDWLEPLPVPQSRPDPSSPSRPWRFLLGSDLEKVSRSSKFLEEETDGRRVGHIGAECVDSAPVGSAPSSAPRGGMGLKSHLPPSLLHPAVGGDVWGLGEKGGPPLSAPWTAPEISAQEPLCTRPHCLKGPRKEG